MYKDRDPFDLEMGLKRMRNYYPELELSDDQAMKMLELHDSTEMSSRDSGRRAELFSFWEQQIYDLDNVRSFLTDKQLAIFEGLQRKSAEQHEAILKEQDAKDVSEVALLTEYTQWIKEGFLPSMRKESIHVPILFHMEQEKIKYLRADHQHFLAVSRHNAIVKHYRGSRDLEPNKLKLILLYWEQQALIPDYEVYTREADEAVRFLVNFIMEKYRVVAERSGEFFRKKLAEKENQYAEMRLRHLGKLEISGWHVPVEPQTDLAQAQQGLMSMLLFSAGR